MDTVFADSVRIDQSSVAVLPHLGTLSLANVPASQIADSIRSAYARLIKTTAIEVTPLRRVTLLGEVNKPSTYYLEAASTVRDAVAIAGGITDAGSTGHAVIMRETDRIVIPDWERRRDSTVVIHSGDVVWIDREPWLKRNVFSVISGLGLVVSLFYTVTR